MAYFDANSSTPVHPNLQRFHSELLTHGFANHRSQHKLGKQANELLIDAKRSFANYFGVSANNVYFGSSGNELNHAILHMLVEKFAGELFLFTGVEHDSILRPFEQYVQRRQIQAEEIGLTYTGRVRMNELESLLLEGAKVVICQWANQELGTIQNITKVQDLCREAGALLFCDGIAWLGKDPMRGWITPDILTLSAHKVHAPKGAAALIIREASMWQKYTNDWGLRTDSVHLPAAACFARALSMIEKGELMRIEHFRRLREVFLQEIASQPHINVFADEHCAVNTLSVSVTGYKGPDMQAALSDHGHHVTVAYSQREGASRVYAACGPETEKRAASSLRISFGDQNTEKEVVELVQKIKLLFPAG